MTPRESILLRGLFDWVALDRIHWDVSQSMPGAPVEATQEATLKLIYDLVEEGLFELGDVAGDRGFLAWAASLDESMERIRRVYVAQFDDKEVWPWYCWLNLTDNGEDVAQKIESPPSTN